MSRVAKKPVDLPKGVTVTIGADAVTVKGAKGSLTLALKEGIKVVQQESHLEVETGSLAEGMNAIAGSTRATWPTWSRAYRPDTRRSSNWSASATARPCRRRT